MASPPVGKSGKEGNGARKLEDGKGDRPRDVATDCDDLQRGGAIADRDSI